MDIKIEPTHFWLFLQLRSKRQVPFQPIEHAAGTLYTIAVLGDVASYVSGFGNWQLYHQEIFEVFTGTGFKWN